MIPTLEELRAAGELTALDEQLARTLGRLAGEERPEVLLAVALVARQIGRGHTCLDLERWTAEPTLDSMDATWSWPNTEAWCDVLAASTLVAQSSAAESQAGQPLVLDPGGRLYLRRYWQLQDRLASVLEQLAGSRQPEVDKALLKTGLERLFARDKIVTPNWQRIAATVAVLRRLCVITGGPGTGKTTTVARILALLTEQELAAGKPAPRTLLLAPTGKAAARLAHSIRAAKSALEVSPEVLAGIAEEASTIHRALGALRGSSTRFRHGPERPLLADLVVLDEASMVDLALMSRLLSALPSSARCLMLGDPDQLASVEAGSVLADICASSGGFSPSLARQVEETAGQSIEASAAAPNSVDPSSAELGGTGGIRDAVVTLRHSYRFSEDGLIEAVALAVRAGDTERVLELFDQPEQDTLRLVESQTGVEVPVALITRAVAHWREITAAAEPLQRLEALEEFRVLCAQRHGSLGALAVDSAIERQLESVTGLRRWAGGHYDGKPLMITRNDYSQELYNGDLGILAEHPDGGPRAYFAIAGGVREVAPAWLPSHESALASSVHKSQGSEHREIAIVLPMEVSPVLSRELLYTALTRAREKLQLFASREILRFAIENPARRSSGLGDRLNRDS